MEDARNWAHKTFSWKYLTTWSPVLQVSPEHRVPPFGLPPWTLFRVCSVTRKRLNPCGSRWRLTISSWPERRKVIQRKLGEVSVVIAESFNSEKTNFTVPLAQGHSLIQSTNLLIHYYNRVVMLDAGFLLLFSHSVVSNSLQPQGLQYTRLSCLSLSPGVCSNSCSVSEWCHPTISSSVTPFSSCPQFFPASGSFPMSQLFASGGQTIGASVSVLPMNIQGWFPLGLKLVWFLCNPRDSQESYPAPQFESINSSVLSLLYCPTLTCTYD